jgi:O-antigen/teichoic acid export membrane protein
MAVPSSSGDAPDERVGLPWRRVSSFVGLPLISLTGQAVLIPVIASVSGASGWAAVALGQALGVGAATILQYGWGFIGPTLLVPLTEPDRARLLWVSMLSRLVVASVLLPVTAVLAMLLAPDGRGLLAALTAVACATIGMSALWFFVGTGRPRLAASYETVPRLLALLAAAVVVVLTRDAIWYPVIFLGGQVAALIRLTLRLSVVSFSPPTWAAALRALREQRAAAATDVVVAVWAAVPTSLLAATAPGALAVFGAGDRTQKLGMSGIQPLFNAFQGWVSEAPPAESVRRMRLAVGATSICGAVGGLLLAIALPLGDRLLFSGTITVDPRVSAAFGVALALYAVTSAITFTVLAPAGRTGRILASTAAGALVAIGGVGVLAPLFGAAGGAAAVALAQAAVLAVQLPEWRRLTRNVPACGPEAVGGLLPVHHSLA